MIPCRICKSAQVKEIGNYTPYKEYSFVVYDCLNCGCRFVWRGGDIYETLHRLDQSPYSFHKDIAAKVKEWFDYGKLTEMYEYLTVFPKNKFIIDAIAKLEGPKIILEIGCSLGYLTAYHIISGHEILGVDISPTAVSEASARFGNHFRVIDDNNFARLGTFDVVYHVGTIGCVDDPIGFTRAILDSLKVGGKLFFNCPDVEAAREMKAIWNKGTPPPDLITLFKDSVWRELFAKDVEVNISYDPYDVKANIYKYIDKLLRRPYLIETPEISISQIKLREAERITPAILKKLFQILSQVNLWNVFPRHVLEIGMFVTMTKH